MPLHKSSLSTPVLLAARYGVRRGGRATGKPYEQTLNVSLNQQDTSKRSDCGFTSESMAARAVAGCGRGWFGCSQRPRCASALQFNGLPARRALPRIICMLNWLTQP